MICFFVISGRAIRWEVSVQEQSYLCNVNWMQMHHLAWDETLAARYIGDQKTKRNTKPTKKKPLITNL